MLISEARACKQRKQQKQDLQEEQVGPVEENGRWPLSQF